MTLCPFLDRVRKMFKRRAVTPAHAVTSTTCFDLKVQDNTSLSTLPTDTKLAILESPPPYHSITNADPSPVTQTADTPPSSSPITTTSIASRMQKLCEGRVNENATALPAVLALQIGSNLASHKKRQIEAPSLSYQISISHCSVNQSSLLCI